MDNKKSNLIMVGAIVIMAVFAVKTLREMDRQMNAYSCETSKHLVLEGETLYQIVRANCQGNKTEALDDAVSTYGTELQVGQVIYLPQNNDCQLRITDGNEPVEDC
jgi:hypothetical protein